MAGSSAGHFTFIGLTIKKTEAVAPMQQPLNLKTRLWNYYKAKMVLIASTVYDDCQEVR